MAKIKYCSEDFLTYYKANFEVEYLPLYLNGDKDKLAAIFDDDVVITGDLEFEWVPLFTPDDFEIPTKYIKENSKSVFSMLKGLTRSQATKEELWFTMIHVYYLDYLLKYSATIKDNRKVAQLIKNIIFFNYGNIRSLVVNHLAKYWWIGKRTFDINNQDNPYWLTDFYASIDPTGKSIAFFASKFTNNPNFSLGIIEGIKIACEAGKVKNKKETYSFINEHFNFVGGVRVLDIMTREQVKAETLSVIDDLVADKLAIAADKRNKIIINE